MAKTLKVEIDINKISKLIKDNHMLKKTFCKSVGHTDSWLDPIMKSGTMPLSDYLLIKQLYDVDIIKEKQEEPKEYTIDEKLDILMRSEKKILKNQEFIKKWLRGIADKENELLRRT